MRFLTTITLILTTLTLASAWPHRRGVAPADTDEDMLEKPMHTTALMAGEAWKLTERVRMASRTAVPHSAPTKFYRFKDQSEL